MASTLNHSHLFNSAIQTLANSSICIAGHTGTVEKPAPDPEGKRAPAQGENKGHRSSVGRADEQRRPSRCPARPATGADPTRQRSTVSTRTSRALGGFVTGGRIGPAGAGPTRNQSRRRAARRPNRPVCPAAPTRGGPPLSAASLA